MIDDGHTGAERPMSPWHPAALIATVFGVGRLPWAPGTWGSLAALPLAWALLTYAGVAALAVALVVITAAGTWAAAVVIERTKTEDPRAVVVDEVAGQWLALLFTPPDPVAFALGFALFRIADTFKPWPISWLDRRLKGGFGVMADDLAAGALAAVGLWLISKVVAFR